MRFGCCADVSKVKAVQEAGYDYIELPVADVMPEQPDSEFDSVRQKLGEAEIVPEAWNCLLPKDLRVTGPEVDGYRLERFIRTAFWRIEELGGEIVVFGSGGARTVPEGFPMDEARDQIIEFLAMAGQVAGIHGITIVVEPLNKRESNIINSVPEAVEIMTAVGHPFVKVLADLYHIDEESQSLEDVLRAGDDLAHTHTADTGRLCPGTGSYPNADFIRMLKRIGYDERLSVECIFRDWDVEPRKALEYLRELDVKADV